MSVNLCMPVGETGHKNNIEICPICHKSVRASNQVGSFSMLGTLFEGLSTSDTATNYNDSELLECLNSCNVRLIHCDNFQFVRGDPEFSMVQILAAHRYGIRRVILPERNLKDLVEVPSAVLANLEVSS